MEDAALAKVVAESQGYPYFVQFADHPELLDGEHTRPGDARRWILVTREKGIAPSAGRVSCEASAVRLPSSCMLRRAMGLEDNDAKIGERCQRPLDAWSDLVP